METVSIQVDDGDGKREFESRGGQSTGRPDVHLFWSGTQQFAQVQRLRASR